MLASHLRAFGGTGTILTFIEAFRRMRIHLGALRALDLRERAKL